MGNKNVILLSKRLVGHRTVQRQTKGSISMIKLQHMQELRLQPTPHFSQEVCKITEIWDNWLLHHLPHTKYQQKMELQIHSYQGLQSSILGSTKVKNGKKKVRAPQGWVGRIHACPWKLPKLKISELKGKRICNRKTCTC